MTGDYSLIFIPAFVVLFLWLGLVSFFYFRLNRHYRRLIGDSKAKDLKKVMEQLLDQFDLNKKEINQLKKTFEALSQKNLVNLQKVGLVRFNPFADTGGNQSFAMALLDGHDNGLVVSTLHSRQSTRIYAKPVVKGKGQGFDLSAEEKQALSHAQGKKSSG